MKRRIALLDERSAFDEISSDLDSIQTLVKARDEALARIQRAKEQYQSTYKAAYSRAKSLEQHVNLLLNGNQQSHGKLASDLLQVSQTLGKTFNMLSAYFSKITAVDAALAGLTHKSRQTLSMSNVLTAVCLVLLLFIAIYA